MTRGRVAVVVLGPLARSPRMVNHARSLARRGYDVSLIGYPAAPRELPGEVRVCLLEPGLGGQEGSSKLPFLAAAARRMSVLLVRLVARLIAEKPRWILVQNPPTFPTLPAAWFCARLHRGRLIVDWHNYGYTMLALRLGSNHPMVQLHRWCEGSAAHLADAHLCVSAAMRDDLARRWGLAATVLYDRPTEFLQPSPQPGGRLVVVCPCGWTADENVGLLLDALHLFPSPAALQLHLTGDGPLRASFDAPIQRLRDAGFSISTGFLPEAEYRDLLRRADLGVSLHTSSSGLDLAMKVADLFAARVPVCAWDYGACLREQVRDSVTGFLFKTAEELAALLRRLIVDPAQLAEMRKQIEQQWQQTWDDAWERAVTPLLP
jgi:beta-1,4-mannosyltransferase